MWPEDALANAVARRRSAAHRRLKRRAGTGKRACIYARFSSKFQHSIEDQVRTCREWCESHGLDVDDALVFVDRAQTGKKSSRPGLDAMKQAILGGRVDCVVVFSTNRLYRKTFPALQFAQQFIVEAGVRGMFVTQNLDTDDEKNWQLFFNFHAMVDEFQLKNAVGHIRAGHEGLLLLERVHNTLAFGYVGTDIEGALTRRQKPSQQIEVDEPLRNWVIQIFHWFVFDNLTYKAIARRLNLASATPPPKTNKWTRNAVRYLLTNRRYIGDWSYGRRETIWISELDNTRQVLREKPLRDHRIERLRIVDDKLFAAAQDRVDSLRLGEGTGRWASDSNGDALIDVLHRVLWCPKHACYLVPGGARGRFWICRGCKRELNPGDQHLYSHLPRRLTRELVIEAIVATLSLDDATTDDIVAKATEHIEDVLTRPTTDTAMIDDEISAFTSQIKSLLDNPGDTAEDQAETESALKQKRERRAGLRAQKAEIEAQRTLPIEIPSAVLVRSMAIRVRDFILSAAESDNAADRRVANALVHKLTGGRIMLEQVGERAPRKGYLRGTLAPAILETITAEIGVAGLTTTMPKPITIDFVKTPRLDEDAAGVGMMLQDRPDLTLKQIGAAIGFAKSRTTKALNRYCEMTGLQKPNMKRRGQNLRNAAEPPMFIRIAESVGRMFLEGKLLAEITDAVRSNRTTVEKSLRYWCAKHGIEYVDGRTRRKQLSVKSRPSVS